ncbi:MAG: cupin domain-containing protein [Alphaproteobacteria bacterium]
MEINADFSRRAAVHAAALPWVPSPIAGVERKMLDRVGGEVARATSIVRYAPHSRFSPHVHGGGEEFLVLDGIFQDEHGDFAAGSYVRNPPTSRHTPGSGAGCTIFVKLWQFDLADRHPVVDTVPAAGDPRLADAASGVRATTLHRDARETVRAELWAPGARIRAVPAGGIELLVLDGGFAEGGEAFGPWSWLRLPDGAPLDATAGPDGCRVWIKEGHLRFVEAELAALAAA